jgi:hypothetical protein
MLRSPAFIGAFKLHNVRRRTGFLQVAVSEVPTTHYPGAISVPRRHFRYSPETCRY